MHKLHVLLNQKLKTTVKSWDLMSKNLTKAAKAAKAAANAARIAVKTTRDELPCSKTVGKALHKLQILEDQALRKWADVDKEK